MSSRLCGGPPRWGLVAIIGVLLCLACLPLAAVADFARVFVPESSPTGSTAYNILDNLYTVSVLYCCPVGCCSGALVALALLLGIRLRRERCRAERHSAQEKRRDDD